MMIDGMGCHDQVGTFGNPHMHTTMVSIPLSPDVKLFGNGFVGKVLLTKKVFQRNKFCEEKIFWSKSSQQPA